MLETIEFINDYCQKMNNLDHCHIDYFTKFEQKNLKQKIIDLEQLKEIYLQS